MLESLKGAATTRDAAFHEPPCARAARDGGSSRRGEATRLLAAGYPGNGGMVLYSAHARSQVRRR